MAEKLTSFSVKSICRHICILKYVRSLILQTVQEFFGEPVLADEVNKYEKMVWKNNSGSCFRGAHDECGSVCFCDGTGLLGELAGRHFEDGLLDFTDAYLQGVR